MVKKWLDPKKSVTFRVVPRPIRDPLRGQEGVGDYMLNPVIKKRTKNGAELTDEQKVLIDYFKDPEYEGPKFNLETGNYIGQNGEEIEVSEYYEYERDNCDKKEAITLKDLEKEFGKINVKDDPSTYGIHFKDNTSYNYLQHLQYTNPATATASIKFHSVEAAEDEENSCEGEQEEDILEINRAIEDSDYIDNDLSDGFFSAFDAEKIPEKYLVPQERDNTSDASSQDSPIINEHEISKILETLLNKEYQDDSNSVISIEHENNYANKEKPLMDCNDKLYFDSINNYPETKVNSEIDPSIITPDLKSKILKCATQLDNTDEEQLVELERNPKRLPFDVESVLDTASNIYNHPSFIVDHSHKLSGKSHASEPKFSPLNNEHQILLKNINESVQNLPNVALTRSANETPEEKKNRKNIQKLYNKTRRIAKKEVKVMFKKELIKRASNYDTLNNTHVIKI